MWTRVLSPIYSGHMLSLTKRLRTVKAWTSWQVSSTYISRMRPLPIKHSMGWLRSLRWMNSSRKISHYSSSSSTRWTDWSASYSLISTSILRMRISKHLYTVHLGSSHSLQMHSSSSTQLRLTRICSGYGICSSFMDTRQCSELGFISSNYLRMSSSVYRLSRFWIISSWSQRLCLSFHRAR